MAFGIHRSRRAHPRTAAVAAAGPAIYVRPVGAALTGLLALIVGAWGAVAGYVGPYFDFRPVALQTWVANLPNGLLHLLPGAVAAAAGLMLVAMGPARRSVRGGAFALPGLLLLAAGAWFVVGPLAWPTFEHSAPFVTGVSATRNLLNIGGASYAPGLVLVMLGGMALKAASVPPVAVEDPYMPAEAVAPGSAPAGSAAGATTGTTAPVTERTTVPAGSHTTVPAGSHTTVPAGDRAAVDPAGPDGGV
jgi:hypothetical protein